MGFGYTGNIHYSRYASYMSILVKSSLGKTTTIMYNVKAVRNDVENRSIRKKLQKVQKLVQDIERFRQKALPPHPTNIKDAESHYKLRARKPKLPDLSKIDLPILQEDLRKNIIKYYQYSKVLMRNQKLKNHLHKLYKQKRKVPVKTRISLNYAQLVKPEALRNLRLRTYEQRTVGGETKPNVSGRARRLKSSSVKNLPNSKANVSRTSRPSTNNSNEMKGDKYKLNALKSKISKKIKPIDSDSTLKATASSLDIVNIHQNRSLQVKRLTKPNKTTTLVAKKPSKKRRRRQRSKQLETPEPLKTNEIPEPESKKPKTVEFKIDYNKIMDKYRIKPRDPYPKTRVYDVSSLSYRPFQSTPSEILKRILTVRVPSTNVEYKANKEPVKHPFYSYERLEKEALYAEKIRLAVLGGGSRDPNCNERLSKVLKTAKNEKVSCDFLNRIINTCKEPRNGEKRLKILEIELGRGIHILCTAYTCNFSLLKRVLGSVLKRYNARFSSIIQHFTSCPVIEAIAPPRTCINCQANTAALEKDAYELNVNSIDILDYDTREVSIKCAQADMFAAVRDLPKKGYAIQNIDFGFKAKKFIVPMGNDFNMYWRFLAVLEELDDIDSVTDNVH
uniref:TACO1/YebC-like second and third domain-containing protein n=1 Tax=Glossina brevipalpis TaxID=37001 RepID=A0A1A9X1L0_9MUSC